MATQSEVQEFLRFLSRDAKVPLNVAMAKIEELQQNSLSRHRFEFRCIPYKEAEH